MLFVRKVDILVRRYLCGVEAVGRVRGDFRMLKQLIARSRWGIVRTHYTEPFLMLLHSHTTTYMTYTSSKGTTTWSSRPGWRSARMCAADGAWRSMPPTVIRWSGCIPDTNAPSGAVALASGQRSVGAGRAHQFRGTLWYSLGPRCQTELRNYVRTRP